jgi:hypothetical protein
LHVGVLLLPQNSVVFFVGRQSSRSQVGVLAIRPFDLGQCRHIARPLKNQYGRGVVAVQKWLRFLNYAPTTAKLCGVIRATEAGSTERAARPLVLPCQSRRVSWITVSLARKGGDSDERSNLQQTFCRELLAANGSTGRVDRSADSCCGKIRLVTLVDTVQRATGCNEGQTS